MHCYDKGTACAFQSVRLSLFATVHIDGRRRKQQCAHVRDHEVAPEAARGALQLRELDRVDRQRDVEAARARRGRHFFDFIPLIFLLNFFAKLYTDWVFPPIFNIPFCFKIFGNNLTTSS